MASMPSRVPILQNGTSGAPPARWTSVHKQRRIPGLNDDSLPSQSARRPGRDGQITGPVRVVVGPPDSG